MIVRDLRPAIDAVRCDEILASLPDFFGHEGGIAACRAAIREQRGFVVEQDAHVVGFLTVAGDEVTWMAVDAAWRRKGIGSRLMSAVLINLRADGVGQVRLYTSDSETCEGTRRFYAKHGFAAGEPHTPPGWNETGVLMTRDL